MNSTPEKMDHKIFMHVESQMIRVGSNILTGPISVSQLCAIFGPPDRISEGKIPAPYGFKNNQAYIYDELGVYWLKDHITELFVSVSFIFKDGSAAPSMPLHFFNGYINILGSTIDSKSSRTIMVEELRNILHRCVAGIWTGYAGIFHIYVQSGGKDDDELLAISVGLNTKMTRGKK